MLRDLASGLHADLRSGKAVPALAAGFTSGLGLLVAQVAFGSFIFSGPLASYSSQGVGLVLFGNFAACLVVALGGGYRGAIAGLSPALVIVMATIGFSMDAEGHPLFVTTVVALMLSAVATGVCCLLIGRFRRANLVRFIPYPVAGGFVAGIGGAVCLAAMSLMGAEPDWRAPSGAAGALGAVEVEPRRSVRDRPVPGPEALAPPPDPAAERRARRRRLPPSHSPCSAFPAQPHARRACCSAAPPTGACGRRCFPPTWCTSRGGHWPGRAPTW